MVPVSNLHNVSLFGLPGARYSSVLREKKAESHSQTTKQCDRAFQTERSVYLNVRVRGADDVLAPGRTAGCPVWSAHCCSPCRTGGWGEKNVK